MGQGPRFNVSLLHDNTLRYYWDGINHGERVCSCLWFSLDLSKLLQRDLNICWSFYEYLLQSLTILLVEILQTFPIKLISISSYGALQLMLHILWSTLRLGTIRHCYHGSYLSFGMTTDLDVLQFIWLHIIWNTSLDLNLACVIIQLSVKV